MWMKPDGRVITVSIPSERFPTLLEAVLALSESQRGQLDEILQSREGVIADSLSHVTFDSKVEAIFEGQALPEELIRSLDWKAMADPGSSLMDGIELRWSLDVVSIVRQALVDFEDWSAGVLPEGEGTDYWFMTLLDVFPCGPFHAQELVRDANPARISLEYLAFGFRAGLITSDEVVQFELAKRTLVALDGFEEKVALNLSADRDEVVDLLRGVPIPTVKWVEIKEFWGYMTAKRLLEHWDSVKWAEPGFWNFFQVLGVDERYQALDPMPRGFFSWRRVDRIRGSLAEVVARDESRYLT